MSDLQQVTEGEKVSFYHELLKNDTSPLYIYDLICKRGERVKVFVCSHSQRQIRDDVQQCLEQVIRQYGYYQLDSPIVLPQTDYFRYLLILLFVLIRSFPKQSAILDAFGTPSILRPDLRTSFLTYYGRCVNTTIRRYEFGTVFKAALGRGGDSTYQYSASIDNVWLQKQSQK